MDYTLLVIARNEVPTKRGCVSHVQESPGVWGVKEVPPDFAFIAFSGTQLEVRFVARECRWDFSREIFRHKDTGDDYDADDDVVIEESDFSEGYANDELLADLIIEDRTTDTCADLYPAFVGDDMRRYWWSRWYPYRKLPGGKALLETVRFGTFSDTRKVFRQMSSSQRQAFFIHMTELELKYIKAICLSNSIEEYNEYMA